MAYEKTNWIDHVVEKPATYTITENRDGTVTQVPAFGEVLQQGTPINAAHLNKMEKGIEEAHLIAEGKMAATTHEIILLANSWQDGRQSVAVDGITAESTVVIASAPQNHSQYCQAGVYCSAQEDGKLIFRADTVPETDLTVNILTISATGTGLTGNGSTGSSTGTGSGVAAAAYRLATPRTISLGGEATGEVDFDGSTDVTINADIEQLENAELEEMLK